MFFFLSFILNANLVLYSIVLIYIATNEWKKCESIKCFCLKMCYYIDFIFLPIIFYLLKQIMFPTYGRYQNYNQVDLNRVFQAISFTIKGILPQMVLVVKQYLFPFLNYTKVSLIYVVIILLLFSVVKFIKRKGIKIRFVLENNSKCLLNYKKQVIRLVSGCCIFAIGMFPFVVVRQHSVLSVYGVEDRDSVLLPIGVAIIFGTIIDTIFFSKKLQCFTACIITILGTFSLNYKYLSYQKVAYWQEALVSEMQENFNIRNNSNFLFLTNDSFDADYGLRFYSLNGMSVAAFGDRSRLFLEGYGDLVLLEPGIERENLLMQTVGFEMDDYDFNNSNLDGVIVYTCPLTLSKTLQLKLEEIFNVEKFDEDIQSLGILEYYAMESEEADIFLEGYKY